MNGKSSITAWNVQDGSPGYLIEHPSPTLTSKKQTSCKSVSYIHKKVVWHYIRGVGQKSGEVNLERGK
jgi:hypothetical protein